MSTSLLLKVSTAISPRWHKVLGDLWSNKTRTTLAVLSIAVGVFAMGTVLSLYIILLNDLNTDYRAANPYSAWLATNGFNADLLYTVEHVPGVARAEGRSMILARTRGRNHQEYTLQITAIPPLGEMLINHLRFTEAVTLNDHQAFIERSSLALVPIKQGDTLTVELTDGTTRELFMAGVVHDVTGYPSGIQQQGALYVNQHTMEWLGGPAQFTRLYLTLTEKQNDLQHVNDVTKAVRDKLEKDGRDVFAYVPPTLDQHPLTTILAPMLIMLGILGLLSVGLSGFLVINTINALLTQHVKQIGLMKAIGASQSQIAVMYIALAMGFGVLALLVAIPLSLWQVNDLASGFAEFFNFNLRPLRYPMEALILQIVIALVVPALVALVPVINGTRLTVNEAINIYGLGKGRFGRNWFDNLLGHIHFLSRPWLVSFRNTFRRKIRLLITLATLTLGGAIFIGILSLRVALDAAIAETLGFILSDVNVNLQQPYRSEKIEQLIEKIDGVKRIETWGEASGNLISLDGATSTQVAIFGAPADSTLIKPVLTEGRWLTPADQNALVIGPHLLNKRPDIKVGDELTIKINNKDTFWKVVGLYKLIGNVEPPLLYANRDYLDLVTGQVGRGVFFRIATEPHDDATQERVDKEIQASLKEAGVQIASTQTGAYLRNVNNSFTFYLIGFSMVMALLSALVGGLGLMSTMSMNVIERTREIGVIRSIGASNGDVLRLIIGEGVLIGLMSWVLGVLLAIPLSSFLETAVGYAFTRGPLPLAFAIDGALGWLIFVVLVSVMASFLPAWNASRLTVRDVLVYE